MSLITFIEILAILVGAFSGFIEARRKRMDLVGVFTVAFITAFGGGTLRDILLDRRPLFWVIHQEYAILIFVLALVASPAIRTLRQIVSERLIVIADAVGLGLYIAQQIVREHHGEIGYHHENGEVVFTVRLPLAG